MFRARDSCGADVRRGRSPKCLFIKATATGNTINGLNDEINKPSEAGHGGAQPGLRWPGRCCWAEPQTCLQARALPGPSHPACPPNMGPAPVPPPPHTSPCPVLTQGHMVHTAAPPRHSLRCATPARAGPSPLPRWAFLWGPSPPPKPPQMYQDGAGLGVYFFYGYRRPNLGLQPAWEWARGPVEVSQSRHFPLLTPSWDSVRFPVSGKLYFPWVTDG